MQDSLKWYLGVCLVFFSLGTGFGACSSPMRKAPLRSVAGVKEYQVNGKCDGLPQVQLATPPGFCVGMVDSGDDLVMPRGILSLNSKTLVLVDMGGWTKYQGKVYLLRRQEQAEGGGFIRELLLDHLDRPHGAALGPDGKVYIGAAGSVIRFKPLDPQPQKTVEIVLKGLPEKGRHPLKSFVFDQDGYFYLNIGSFSDNCEAKSGRVFDSRQPCWESDGADLLQRRGVVRRYAIDSHGNIDPDFTLFSEGLRNSMALAVHPRTGELYQGENSRDSIKNRDPKLNDDTLPPEELNLLEKGQHYGWPYCYSMSSKSPEYPDAICSRYRSPLMLWPAHAAPLSMIFYSGQMFPSWYQDKLIVAFHGYRENGHRIVAFDSDRRGRPIGDPVDLVSGWNENSAHPRGAPVVMSVSEDGSIYLTEDLNRTLLRIFYNTKRASTISH